MGVFKEVACTGKVIKTLIVPDGINTEETVASTLHDDRIQVTFEGFSKERHSGLTRLSCVRVRDVYEEGTAIRNVRQITIISEEEMALVAQGMGIKHVEPEWLGANLLVSGIPHLTLLPPSTRLLFSGGASLVVDLENLPCRYPAKEIKKEHEEQSKFFVKNSMHLRGITAWVEKEGSIGMGDSVKVFIPNQTAWPGIGS